MLEFLKGTGAVAALSAALVATTVGLSRPSGPEPPAPAAPPAAQEAQEPAAIPAAIELTVLDDATGEPIPGATIRALVDLREEVHTTDARGKATVATSTIPLRKGSASVDVWAEGYVQQRHSWGNGEKDPKIPANHTIRLLRGTETYGGVVRNERGAPVAGATVDLWGHLAEKKQANELVFMIRVKTDAEGRWRTSSLRPMKWINLYIAHPDYLSDSEADARGNVPIDELQAGTNEQVMRDGATVEGRVLDAAGGPIAGAAVGWILNPDTLQTVHNGLPTVDTDAQGRFRFTHASPEAKSFIAIAKGHAPGLLTDIKIEAGMEPLEFRLPAPARFEGRVVDPSGDPISGVDVLSDFWRGHRSLGVYLSTDEDGRFRWDEGPPEPVEFAISKEGYLPINRLVVEPTGERSITLRPAFKITGKVLDAGTGDSVQEKSAEVQRGLIDPKSGEIRWTPIQSALYWGDLSISMPRGDESIVLKITGFGYKPFESRMISAQEHAVDLGEIRLEPVERTGPAGVVLDTEGRPLGGAKIILATRDRGFHLLGLNDFGEAPVDPNFPITTMADDEGRFSFPPVDGPYKLAVIDPRGFARLNREEFERAGEVRLAPYGVVEGRASHGDEPAVGEEVRISSDEPIGAYPTTYQDAIVAYDGSDTRLAVTSHVSLSISGTSTRTDDQGRFRFEGVPPIDMTLYHLSGSSFAHTAHVKVDPGRTTRVDLGGEGRPVVGRFVVAEANQRAVDFGRRTDAFLQSARSDLPFPEGLSGAEKTLWLERWWASPEGREYRNGQVSRPIFIEPDGTFRALDVPAGSYKIIANFPGLEGDTAPRARAFVEHTFEVPDIPGGRSDEPLDLGAIEVEIRPSTNPGG